MNSTSTHAKVLLFPLHVDDVDDILTWVNDATIVGNIAAFSGEPFSREQELRYVQSMIASKDDVVFSIFDDDNGTKGRYLGQVGVHQIHQRSRVGRLGCIIAHQHDMGKGIGSAAIKAMLDIAFSTTTKANAASPHAGLSLHKVWLMIFKENTRSHRTYARLGFVDEGLLREEYFLEEHTPEGTRESWHDMVRMSVLARQWPS